MWFGASHPTALRRAVRLGDGFFGAGSTTSADFADQVRVVRDALAELERDPSEFPIAKRVYIAVDDDEARAQARLADALDLLYGQLGGTGMIRVGVYGPPETCVRGLREVADAGAGLILLTTLFDDTEQMERLAADVIPALS